MTSFNLRLLLRRIGSRLTDKFSPAPASAAAAITKTESTRDTWFQTNQKFPAAVRAPKPKSSHSIQKDFDGLPAVAEPLLTPGLSLRDECIQRDARFREEVLGGPMREHPQHGPERETMISLIFGEQTNLTGLRTARRTFVETPQVIGGQEVLGRNGFLLLEQTDEVANETKSQRWDRWSKRHCALTLDALVVLKKWRANDKEDTGWHLDFTVPLHEFSNKNDIRTRSLEQGTARQLLWDGLLELCPDSRKNDKPLLFAARSLKVAQGWRKSILKAAKTRNSKSRETVDTFRSLYPFVFDLEWIDEKRLGQCFRQSAPHLICIRLVHRIT